MIKIENVTKVFKLGNEKIYALNDVSFSVEKGEFVSIIGPSGSGKSTLMNIIGLLDIPSSGNYYLDGKDVSKLTDNDLALFRSKSIGFVFQNFNLLPKLTALENVMVPLLYQGYKNSEAKELAKESLTKVGLSHRYNHLPNQLSGGQMQRVAIARAIVSHPKIILADEPTGAVDSKTGKDIIKIFEDLNKHGETIVLITHDMNIASHAKRIMKISDGKISKGVANEVK